ncbi:MAG: hypothetical protein PSN37_01600 [Alphaproteobacteria bacterium]|nr:hypothetical protein [Alphaproteobacteria bacterium]
MAGQETGIDSYERISSVLEKVDNPDPGVLPAEINLPYYGMIARIKKSSVAFTDNNEAEKTLFYVPVRYYRGIMLTTLTTCNDIEPLAFIVNLYHDDERLNVPLCVTFDIKEGQRYWEEWGAALECPLIVHGFSDDPVDFDQEIFSPLYGYCDLQEDEPPRAMIIASCIPGQFRMPGLQYSGWDLVAWD